jgi:hypothetical protein
LQNSNGDTVNSSDWLNIADCANQRVMTQTFSFDDEENNILGDLETREMAKSQAYRESLIAGAYMEVTMELARAFNREDLLDALESQTVTGIEVRITTK